MNAFETIAVLFALRLILPIGMLFLLGEWMRNQGLRRHAEQ